MRYRGDVPGRPDDLTAPGDVEELAEMIGNEGSELVDCCTVAPMWPAEGSSRGEAKKPQRGYQRRHAEGGRRLPRPTVPLPAALLLHLLWYRAGELGVDALDEMQRGSAEEQRTRACMAWTSRQRSSGGPPRNSATRRRRSHRVQVGA